MSNSSTSRRSHERILESRVGGRTHMIEEQQTPSIEVIEQVWHLAGASNSWARIAQ